MSKKKKITRRDFMKLGGFVVVQPKPDSWGIELVTNWCSIERFCMVISGHSKGWPPRFVGGVDLDDFDERFRAYDAVQRKCHQPGLQQIVSMTLGQIAKERIMG